MKRLLAITMIAGLHSASANVLVDAKPPLTQEMVDRTAELFDWALDIQLTVAQRDVVRDALVAVWKQQSAGDIKGEGELLDLYNTLVKSTPAQRDHMRAKLRPVLLQRLEQDSNDPLARTLAAAYKSAHTVIADGNPPLTRQAIDAYIELIAFVASEAQPGFKLDRTQMAGFESQLKAAWGQLTEPQRQAFAAMPTQWAAVRAAWAQASESDRAKARKAWQAMSAPATNKPTDPAQFAMVMQQLRGFSAIQRSFHTLNMQIIDKIGTPTSVWKWEWVRH